VTSVFEQHAEAYLGHPLPAPQVQPLKPVGKQRFAEILQPPYRRRTIMLTVFNFFQAIAFYGFGNWLPALVSAQNHNAPRSAQVSFLITLAFPIGPLLSSIIAEKFERKWQIVGTAVGTAVFGMLFATHTASLGLVVLGISDYSHEQPFGILLSCLSVGVISNPHVGSCGWVRLFVGTFVDRIYKPHHRIPLPAFWNHGSFCFYRPRNVRCRRLCRSVRTAHPWPHTRTDF
jgi:hypothetical protein